jgi:hypothetical protein
MASISDPFRTVDFAAIPPVRHFTARDGATLAYRKNSGSGGDGSVVLTGLLGPFTWNLATELASKEILRGW